MLGQLYPLDTYMTCSMKNFVLGILIADLFMSMYHGSTLYVSCIKCFGTNSFCRLDYIYHRNLWGCGFVVNMWWTAFSCSALLSGCVELQYATSIPIKSQLLIQSGFAAIFCGFELSRFSRGFYFRNTFYQQELFNQFPKFHNVCGSVFFAYTG